MMAAGYMAPRRQTDLEMLDIFSAASYLEMDYLHEAANQERFVSELLPRIGSDTIYVPKVYRDLTTRKVFWSASCEELSRGSGFTEKSGEGLRPCIRCPPQEMNCTVRKRL